MFINYGLGGPAFFRLDPLRNFRPPLPGPKKIPTPPSRGKRKLWPPLFDSCLCLEKGTQNGLWTWNTSLENLFVPFECFLVSVCIGWASDYSILQPGFQNDKHKMIEGGNVMVGAKGPNKRLLVDFFHFCSFKIFANTSIFINNIHLHRVTELQTLWDS